MQLLTNWVLGPVWQGILLAGCCYVIPFFDVLAMVIQGFITLRQGMLKGFVVTVGSVCLGVLLGFIAANLYFDVDLSMLTTGLLWALVMSLPFWLFAGLLRKTVSLVYTLQVMTLVFIGLFLFSFIADTSIFPSFFAKPVAESVQNLTSGIIEVQKQANVDTTNLLTPENIDRLSNFLVHLFETVSIYTMYIMLLLMARLWQSVAFMPGEFKKEFMNLRTGKLLACGFAVCWLMLLFAPSIWFTFAMTGAFIVGSIWLFVVGLAHVHWAAHQYNASWGALLIFYLLLLLPVFSSLLLMILVIIGFIDGFFDMRAYIANSQKRDLL